MKFYGRKHEIDELRQIRTASHKYARFTVVTGRRRIGKTQLIRQALDDGSDAYIHLVITKKMEKVQTAAHQHVVEHVLNDFSPKWKNEDLLGLWTVTGGVPRYVELLMENDAFNCTATSQDDCLLSEKSNAVSTTLQVYGALSERYVRQHE